MKTVMSLAIISLLISVILSACGPSQAELDATATQVAANIFATQTAQAPTATPTFTPSPSPTATPTATPTPTSTPTITPTPTPRLLAVALTLGDLPAGFKAMPPEQIRNTEQNLPKGASAFGFSNDRLGLVIIGFLVPMSTRADQAAYDNALPQFTEVFAAAVGAGANPKELRGLDDIGEVRAGVTSVNKVGSLSLRWDILGFRRGEVGVLLIVSYPDGDKPAVPIGDLARLLDERISKFLATNP